jgi:superfamily II DNA helicase RecQ
MMDTAAELKQMIGPQAQFRGIQKQALGAVVSGLPLVVAIMPTGGGKSLLFMLPAWVQPNGMTVVVVPLVSLKLA